MDTNTPLAPEVAAPECAPETRAARGPAVHTRAPSQSDLTREVRAQTAEIRRSTRMISQSAGARHLDGIKQRALAQLRQVAEGPRTRKAQRRHAADPLVHQQLARINTGIDRINTREVENLRRENAQLRRVTARPPLTRGAAPRGGQSQLSGVRALHRAATIHYLRTGETTFQGHSLSQLERQAVPQARTMFGGSGTDGGFLLLPEQDTGPIEKLLKEYVPMRQYAEVKSINAYTYKKPMRTSTPGAQWGPELASTGGSGTPKYDLLDFPAHNLYADPAVSSDMLEDASYNIEQEIADGAIEDFAVAEATGFISGDGVEKPYGILGYSSDKYVANASWAWGKIGFLATGASGAFPTPSSSVGSADPILKLQYELKAMYRMGAKWMMNRSSIQAVRVLKDVEGRYIWSESNAITGAPATLDGREVIEAEQMPVIGADAFAIALADWQRAYIVVDRIGMVVTRDNLTAYPQVRFRTRKRVGGGIKNFEAIKLLKFA